MVALAKTKQIAQVALLILVVAFLFVPSEAFAATPPSAETIATAKKLWADIRTISYTKQGAFTSPQGYSCVRTTDRVAIIPTDEMKCTYAGLTGSCLVDGNGVNVCEVTDASGQKIVSSEGTLLVLTTTTGTDGKKTTEVTAPVADFFKKGFMGTILLPIAVVSWLIQVICNFLLGLAAIFFNWTVTVLVFQYGTFFGNSAAMLGAWGILRDLGNIMLLFGFVYMGVMTILDVGNFTAKKALPRLVIFAVLLNFSLFTAEIVIDTSNALAASLYRQSYQEDCGDADSLRECVGGGFGAQIMQKAGFASAFDKVQAAATADGENFFEGMGAYWSNPVGRTLESLGLAIFAITMMTVLIAGGVLLVSRAIHLAILMVTSPVGFAGMAIPPFKKMAQSWWKKLIDQAFFAPVFILLLLISLKLVEGLRSIIPAGADGKAVGLASAISSDSAIDFGPILFMIVTIGFMIGALKVAKTFGIYGADAIVDRAEKTIYGTTGMMTAGTAGWVGRRTLGRASMGAASAIRRTRFGSTLLGSTIAGVADKGGAASFDARGIPGAGKMLGAAQKGGRAGELKKAAENANKQKDAMEKVRKAEDATFEVKQDEILRKAQLAEAKGDPEAVERARKEIEANKKQFEAEKVNRRLSKTDKTIYEYSSQEARDAEKGKKDADAAQKAAEAAAQGAAEQRKQAEGAREEHDQKEREGKEKHDRYKAETVAEETRTVENLRRQHEQRTSETNRTVSNLERDRNRTTDAAQIAQIEAAIAAAREANEAAERDMEAAITTAQANSATRQADIDRDILERRTEYRERKVQLDSAVDQAQAAMDEAKTKADAAKAYATVAKERNERYTKQADKFSDYKYGSKELARNYDKAGRWTGIQEFHAAAAGIRTDLGKSETEKTLEHLKHLMEHPAGDHAPKGDKKKNTHTEESHDETHDTSHADDPHG